MQKELKKKKYSVGLVGNGSWAKVIANEINNHKNFYLKAIFSKSKFIPIQNCSLIKCNNFEKIIKLEKFDCFYVAVNPSTNYQIFKILKKNKIPCIFEKPLIDNIKNCNNLEEYICNSNHSILTNLPNIYSNVFEPLKKNLNLNKNNIKKIYIFEGAKGGLNKNIHPLLDWGIHSLTLIFKLFINQKINSINLIKIKSEINSMIYKININYDKFNIKILTGNGFKKKIRKLKIFLDNDDIINCDFNNHILYYNNELIFKSKKTPISLLLDKLEENLKHGSINNDIENIKISIKAIKFLIKYL